MKRIVILLSFGIFIIAAVYYAAPHYVAARAAADRNAAYAQMLAERGPLVLDAATQAILAGADRVETFLLVDPNADSDEKEMPVSSWPHGQFLDQCQVMQVGTSKDRTFAAALQSALSEAPSSVGTDGKFSPALVGSPNEFGADVGFRVWKGKAHVDIFAGLYCNRVEIMSEDAHHKPLVLTETALGASRPAFLALSRQAFPQDKPLAALPSQL